VGLQDIADPAIEWEWSDRMASLFGGPRTYRGFEEIGVATLEWLEAWESYWMTANGFIDAGDEIVVVFMRLHARTAASDRVTEQSTTAVWTLRNGKAVRVRYYDDKADALEAAGLSE
jgi:ketosteroid isomerase-like protein